MIYFDTAYLAKCYLTDQGHEAVRALAATDQVACCELGRVEVAAAFHRVFRERKMTAAMHRSVCRQFAMDEETGLWVWFPATSAILHKAAARMNTMDQAVFVRAADAIHLTCAAEHGFTEIYSSDRHLLAAASAFGLRPRNVIR